MWGKLSTHDNITEMTAKAGGISETTESTSWRQTSVNMWLQEGGRRLKARDTHLAWNSRLHKSPHNIIDQMNTQQSIQVHAYKSTGNQELQYL